MLFKKYSYAVMVLFGLLSCSENKLTGTISDTDTGKSALVYNPDLTPAVGASVAFYSCNDTIAVYKTVTDINGTYVVPSLSDGYYNIVASKDSLMSLQDSVVFTRNNKTVTSDTLGKTGSLTAIAALQVNHDPRTVVVHVLGTNVNSNVDDKGVFSLKQLARGTYSIVLKTSLPDYTPKYATIKIESAKNDTLKDTIYLTYTGIPVVTGLKATYDTTNGVVTLSWNKTNYRDFQDYVIYRDNYDAVSLSTLPVAARSDTVFTDTLFKNGNVDNVETYHYKYRVAMRNNAVVTGATYKYVDIVVMPPRLLSATIVNSIYHTMMNFTTDSASVNDTLLYKYKVETQYRAIRSIQWKNLETSSNIHTTIFDGLYKSNLDSFKLAWSDTGVKRVECIVIDAGGYCTVDTVKVLIVNDSPVLNVTTVTDTVFVYDTVPVKISGSDRFGIIKKWELLCGKSQEFRQISGKDTSLVIDDLQSEKYECIFKCTDDDGCVQYDTLVLNVNHFSIEGNASTIPFRSSHGTVVFNNKQYIIGGFTLHPKTYYNDVWSSDDGMTWRCEAANAKFGKRYDFECFAFNGKIWIAGGYENDSVSGTSKPLNDFWSSSDGKNWEIVTPSSDLPAVEQKKYFVFNNKLWIIFQSSTNGGYLYDIWNSEDGVTWTKSTDKLLMSQMNFVLDIHVYNGKIFVFGEYTVYSSSDGINWNVQYYPSGVRVIGSISSITCSDNGFYMLGSSAASNYLKIELWHYMENNVFKCISSNESNVWSGVLSYFNNSLLLTGAEAQIGENSMVYIYKLKQ
jgi:hypothetical protein